MQRTVTATAAAFVMGASTILVTAAPAEAAPRVPTTSEVSWNFNRAECVQGPDRFWAVGQTRNTVKYLEKPKKWHYQKVTTQIDRYTVGGMWRKMESRSYDWGRFKGGALPTWSTSGVKSAVGATIANGGYMSVKTTVTLKRVRTGPDATVWKYTVRSNPFQCYLDF
jgi:hypothetical protein